MGAKQRRRMLAKKKQTGKSPRTSKKGTAREVKHPYPARKLPVRDQFHIACVIVDSVAMTRIRRIHHYLVEKRAAETQAELANRVTEGAQVQQNFPFSTGMQTIRFYRKLCVTGILFRFLFSSYLGAINN